MLVITSDVQWLVGQAGFDCSSILCLLDWFVDLRMQTGH